MTNSIMADSQTKRRRRIIGYPADSLRFDMVVALLNTIILAGLFLDGWAHNNVPTFIETFFTPYHALLYGGYMLLALFLTGTHFRNIWKGHSFSKALPQGYFLALVGIGLFTIGGIGDLIWHEIFGFEEDMEALLSPTHLLLASGASLFATAPLRAAWQRPTELEQEMKWSQLAPAIISMLVLLSLLTFFTQYATLARSYLFVNRPRVWGDVWLHDTAAIFTVLMPILLMVGAILYLMRRWVLPVGTMTFLIGINYALMFLMTWNVSIPTPMTLPAFVVTGVFADMLYIWLKPTSTRLGAVRWFSFLTPFVMVGLYMGVLLLTKGLWWKIHMWGGVPFLAGVTGLLLSYLVFPAQIPNPATEEASV